MNIELEDRDIESVAKKLHQLVHTNAHYSEYLKASEDIAKKNAAYIYDEKWRKRELQIIIRDALGEYIEKNKSMVGSLIAKEIVSKLSKDNLASYIRSGINEYVQDKMSGDE